MKRYTTKELEQLDIEALMELAQDWSFGISSWDAPDKKFVGTLYVAALEDYMPREEWEDMLSDSYDLKDVDKAFYGATLKEVVIKTVEYLQNK